VMRLTRTPQEGCGTSREKSLHLTMKRAARAFACACTMIVPALILISTSAQAQDPSTFASSSAPGKSFGGAGDMFGKVNKNLDRSKPMNLQGDQLVYDTAGNRVIARGNVEIYYNDNILTADEVIYDQTAGTLTAIGNVTLKEPQGNIIRADRYTLTDDFRDGFVQSLSVVTKDNSTITADRAIRREGNVTEFQNGRFTPCKSDGNTPPLWCISAARIIHDKDAGTITYKDAYFEIFGQPVLYLPYFEHGDSKKKRSGFLAPQYGQSSTRGYITGIPYYWALDPSYDFTFDPLYMTKQGIMYQGEWRHRLANGEYNIDVAGIDQNASDLPVPKSTGNVNIDNKNLAARAALDGWRGSLQTRGQFSLASWWKFGWDVTVDSDDQFRRFYGLDNILLTDRVNQVYLTGQSDRNYFNATLYHFGGLLLSDTSQAGSYTHPVIDYNYVFEDPVLGGELKWDTNILSFTRNNGSTPTLSTVGDQNINRLSTELKWRRRFTDAVGITYTPFGNLRGDIDEFNNFTDPQSVVVDGTGKVTSSSAVGEDTTGFGLATAGATVSYPWVANTASASHIIEPIGQIISRQASGTQLGFPDEDAHSLVFDDTNLFEVSKFSGYDRTELGTRTNAGVQYTFQGSEGGYARFLAGESFHLEGDNLYATPGRDADGKLVYSASSGLETDRSDYVLGAYVAPTDAFRFISQSRFDQADFSLQREDAAAQFQYGPLSTSVAYAFRAADPSILLADPANPGKFVPQQQQDISGSAMLRLTDTWSVGAGVRYDIDAGELRQDSLQVRYADECFILTASYQELLYNNATISDDRSVMLRFELKHLGEFKYKTNATDFNFGGAQQTN
jgi:LPS-assembly protein